MRVSRTNWVQKGSGWKERKMRKQSCGAEDDFGVVFDEMVTCFTIPTSFLSGSDTSEECYRSRRKLNSSYAKVQGFSFFASFSHTALHLTCPSVHCRRFRLMLRRQDRTYNGILI